MRNKGKHASYIHLRIKKIEMIDEKLFELLLETKTTKHRARIFSIYNK